MNTKKIEYRVWVDGRSRFSCDSKDAVKLYVYGILDMIRWDFENTEESKYIDIDIESKYKDDVNTFTIHTKHTDLDDNGDMENLQQLWKWEEEKQW
jgi:hypothetical protein